MCLDLRCVPQEDMCVVSGKSVCTVVTLANWDWFKDWENDKVTKRGDDYDRIKNSIRDRMWEQVLAFFPHLEDKVENTYTPMLRFTPLPSLRLVNLLEIYCILNCIISFT